MRGQVHCPDFRPLFGDEFRLDAIARQDLPEGFPIVPAIGIVGIDAGHSLEFALEILDREKRPHHCFAFIISRAENVARLRHRLLDAVLCGAVPHDEKRLLLLCHRRNPEADSRRDQSVNGFDLLLQDQTSEALDGIFWAGLFLEHQLDLAAGDAAILVHPLGGPLYRANAALAGRTCPTRSRPNNSDPQRLILRQVSGKYTRPTDSHAAAPSPLAKTPTLDP